MVLEVERNVDSPSMDAATAGVIATGAVGVAGIEAAFFAPAWSQQVIEERREARAFRRARRLVAEEMESWR
jgi:hypothetical protein